MSLNFCGFHYYVKVELGHTLLYIHIYMYMYILLSKFTSCVCVCRVCWHGWNVKITHLHCNNSIARADVHASTNRSDGNIIRLHTIMSVYIAIPGVYSTAKCTLTANYVQMKHHTQCTGLYLQQQRCLTDTCMHVYYIHVHSTNNNPPKTANKPFTIASKTTFTICS